MNALRKLICRMFGHKPVESLLFCRHSSGACYTFWFRKMSCARCAEQWEEEA